MRELKAIPVVGPAIGRGLLTACSLTTIFPELKLQGGQVEIPMFKVDAVERHNDPPSTM